MRKININNYIKVIVQIKLLIDFLIIYNYTLLLIKLNFF